MKKKVGRPPKLDTVAMKQANVSFFIILIILVLLLTIATLTIVNPEIYNYIKACLSNIF